MEAQHEGTIFVPVISTNAMHADHKPGNLDKWFNQGEFMRALKAIASVPCSISVEGWDMELLPELGKFVKNHKGPGEVINGEYSHVMPWWFERANRKLITHNFTRFGTDTGHPVTFVSEYSSIPTMTAKAVKDKIGKTPAVYFVDTATTVYSRFCEDGGPLLPISAMSELDKTHAFLADGILHMRMYMQYAGIVNSKFFAFQRMRTAKGNKRTTARDVVMAMKKAVEQAQIDGVPVVFWPMDLESCVIGSKYGALIYEELAEELKNSDIPLGTPSQAYEILLKQAKKISRLYREVNNKWGGYPNQEVLRTDQTIMVHNLKNKNLSEKGQKLLLLGIGSDAYVWRKFTNAGVERLTMETDSGDLTWLGENGACHVITMAVKKHFRKDEPTTFTRELKKALRKSPNALLERALKWGLKNDF